MEEELDSQVIEQETPAKHVFVAPSINDECILSGRSYTYHSAIPAAIAHDVSAECVLGIDEAGRGPVLGMPSEALLKDQTVDQFLQDQWCTDCSISHPRPTNLSSPKPIVLTTPKFSNLRFDRL